MGTTDTKKAAQYVSRAALYYLISLFRSSLRDHFLRTALFQNFRESRSATGMAAYDIRPLAVHFAQRAFNHLVGNGVCKEHQDVRTSYLLIEIRRHLCKHLGFTFIIFTNLLVLSYHTVMAAYDNYTHNLLSCPDKLYCIFVS